MFDDISYAVRFDNGKYYTASGYRPNQVQESEKIEDARLYSFEWQIPKDMYFNAYVFNRDRSYEFVKVKVTKSYEVLHD